LTPFTLPRSRVVQRRKEKPSSPGERTPLVSDHGFNSQKSRDGKALFSNTTSKIKEPPDPESSSLFWAPPTLRWSSRTTALARAVRALSSSAVCGRGALAGERTVAPSPLCPRGSPGASRLGTPRRCADSACLPALRRDLQLGIQRQARPRQALSADTAG